MAAGILDSSGYKVKTTAGAAWQRIAFPGAEGHGALALDGYDRTDIRLHKVTNTNSSGAGSFKDIVLNQVTAGKLDIIVFTTGGTITGAGPGIVTDGIYVAGHTAPGGGIQTYGVGAYFFDRDGSAHNIVWRYMRIRAQKGTPGGADCMSIFAGHDIILDHLSVQWGNDEVVSIYPVAIASGGTDAYDISIQRCFISEGLETHSKGTLIGNDGDNDPLYSEDPTPLTYRITCHRNIYAHNHNRNPFVSAQDVQWAMNTIYNFRNGGQGGWGGPEVDYINNHYIYGPRTEGGSSWIECRASRRPGQIEWTNDASYYVSGNIFDSSYPLSSTPTADQWSFLTHGYTTLSLYTEGDELPTGWERGGPLTDSPVPLTIETAAVSRADLLTDCGAQHQLGADGALSDIQDVIDSDIIDDITDGTGPASEAAQDNPDDYMDSPPPTLAAGTPYTDTAGDGIADTWKTNNGLTLATDYTSSPTKADAYDIPFIEHFLNGTKIRWRHDRQLGGIMRGVNRGQVK